jgi:archaellin
LVKLKNLSILLLVALLASSVFLCMQGARAQQQPQTLADTINQVVSNINLANVSPQWGCVYSQIFGLANDSVFDTLIQEAVNQSDWQDAVWVATLAELNGYSSQIINSSLVTTLENMPMTGNLPITDNSTGTFLMYDRYMINAYRYAEELNVSGWNTYQAFMELASVGGAMLYSNGEGMNRYYDEFAETIEVFLEFALNSNNSTIINEANTFMANLWIQTQSLWNGQYYNYRASEVNSVECEVGNFAMVIAEYADENGSVPNFNRVILDLEYKLLAEGFNSPAWANYDNSHYIDNGTSSYYLNDTVSYAGVLQHATSNAQLRLGETLGAITSLQMLYPYFASGMQSNFRAELQTAWQGLVNSPLYSDGEFSWLAWPIQPYEASFSDDASLLGAMTLFIDGIVPGTGYLAINASNERYQDYQTCFPTSEWQFNYVNQTIRIPVTAGTLSFIFGSQEVTQNFSSNGVYDIQFSNSWNSIVLATKVADLNVTVLQNIGDVTLQPTPAPTTTPTTTPTPTETASPSPSPTPTLNTTPKPTATVTPTHGSPADIGKLWFIAALAAPSTLLLCAIAFYVKKKKRHTN